MANNIGVGTRVKFRDERGDQRVGYVVRCTRTTAVVESLKTEWTLDMSMLLVAPLRGVQQLHKRSFEDHCVRCQNEGAEHEEDHVFEGQE